MSGIKNELLSRCLNVLLIMSNEKKAIWELDLDNFASWRARRKSEPLGEDYSQRGIVQLHFASAFFHSWLTVNYSEHRVFFLRAGYGLTGMQSLASQKLASPEAKRDISTILLDAKYLLPWF